MNFRTHPPLVAEEVKVIGHTGSASLNHAITQPACAVSELKLVKNGQSWVFRYGRGGEPRVLQALARAAADPRSGLDWSDAAAIARRMGLAVTASLKGSL